MFERSVWHCARTRPNDLDERQRDALGRVLQAFSVLTPKDWTWTWHACPLGLAGRILPRQLGILGLHNKPRGLNFIVAVQLLVGLTEKQALSGLQCLTDPG